MLKAYILRPIPADDSFAVGNAAVVLTTDVAKTTANFQELKRSISDRSLPVSTAGQPAAENDRSASLCKRTLTTEASHVKLTTSNRATEDRRLRPRTQRTVRLHR